MPEYLVLSILVVDREKSAPYREAHLAYLTQLKKEGRLQMAGRFSDGTGGMYILTVNSLEEAEQMAKNDPYHANHLRRFTITGWERRL
ncbi:MAG: hypothetical protein A3K61_00740 [Thaumarchaeota archaeon RBG_16_49_8]|nr:MAG: hypothetical protein A3K61_00740 [Thaumarchaeota archaeon RBG_16_49_8]